MSWAEHAQQTLARAGHRSGGARSEVVAQLAGQHCLASAQAIHARLGGRVGLTSVYRALDTLAAHGLVHRVEVDGTACYEPADPSGEHHHHAICSRCGKLTPFEDAELERLLHRLGERLGYDVSGHDVSLRGTCPGCRRA